MHRGVLRGALATLLVAAVWILGCRSPDVTKGALAAVGSTAPSALRAPSAPPASAPSPSRGAPFPATAGDGYTIGAPGEVSRVGPPRCDVAGTQPACRGDEDTLSCRTDADCTAHAHGACQHDRSPRELSCRCAYPCATDADCGSGEACVCAEAMTGSMRGLTLLGGPVRGARCTPARCRSEDDCGGEPCGVSTFYDGCEVTVELACHDRRDACRAQADCKPGETCAFDGARWSCRRQTCQN